MTKLIKKITVAVAAILATSMITTTGFAKANELECVSASEGSNIQTRSASDVARYYPDGSYFSSNRKACTCHSSSNCCRGAGSCNCGYYKYYLDGYNMSESYGVAYQCNGFARMCYHEFNNDGTDVPYYDSNNSFVTLTQTNLRGYLSRIGNQAFVAGRTANDYDHSIFIVGHTNSTVTIYHANYSGGCKVENKTLTYSEFLRVMKEIDWYYTAEEDLVDA